ncbi:MAG: tetratricopeptide repeat protein [Bacteroidales bacterium]|nr:tetratricopeptide repeat protein [Bacteroidales bacterium]
MKTKILATVLLFAGCVSVMAQSSCNTNSTISHEAVRARNFKDAYAPCMEVLKECPTLRYYTFTDAIKILQAFLQERKDNKNSAEYKKYFDELMGVYDLRSKYIPEFQQKMKGVPSLAAALGAKAVDYLAYAPAADLNTAYAWLKESVSEEKSGISGTVLNTFMTVSLQKVKADNNHTDQFFQDYIDASKYADEAIENASENKKAQLKTVKDNLVAMFINSGVADCESLQTIYGPKVEENKADSVFLKKAIAVLKMMGCKESSAYFQASKYMYEINPTADAATGVAFMYYKQENYDEAVKYFDEAFNMETDNDKKAEMAYVTAASLLGAKKYAQAKQYCQRAISMKENYGTAYILLAQIYGSCPNWSSESALNKCTYYVVLDKLNQAKAMDPECAEEANKLIQTYARYTPQAKDLFMLGYKAGDRVTVGGIIGETTTIR